MLRILFFILLLTSCGVHQWLGEKRPGPASKLSSPTIELDQEVFTRSVDEKLRALYSYHLIGQKNLFLFDQEIEHQHLSKLYQSSYYLNLLAVNKLGTEIELELLKLLGPDGTEHFALEKKRRMTESLQSFSQKSKGHAYATEAMMRKLGLIKSPTTFENKDFEQEYSLEEKTKDFVVYEKNVEHLSHILNFRPEDHPHSQLISDNKFPSKVWTITFMAGPNHKVSPAILTDLKARSLKATFFHSRPMPPLKKAFKLATSNRSNRSPSGSISASNDSPTSQIETTRNIDTLDWMPQSPERIVQRTLALMKKTKNDSGILLFHDTHPRTAAAAPKIMDYLKKDGRRVCTIDEIVSQINRGTQTVCP